jgi:hypothetical protein
MDEARVFDAVRLRSVTGKITRSLISASARSDSTTVTDRSGRPLRDAGIWWRAGPSDRR